MAARKCRWGWAGLFGGLAVLTRQQGLLLAVPLVYMLWRSRPLWPWEALRRNLRAWGGLSWLPVGFLIVLLHRWRLGDLRPVFDSLQGFAYSFVISSSADHVVPVQAFLPPWELAMLVMGQLTTTPDLDLIINLSGAGVFVALLVIAWRHMDGAERSYCLVIFLVSFSYYTGPQHPLMGLLRHCYLAFPLFWGAAEAFTRPWQRLAAIGLGLMGMGVLQVAYVWQAWVP